MAIKERVLEPVEEHRDPLSGEKGAHPVGVGVGTAVGAGVTGGALGSAGAAMAATATAGAAVAAGPIGALAGAVVGGIVGGLAGKKIAETVHPTIDAECRDLGIQSAPEVGPNVEDDESNPAYQYGLDSYERYCGRNFEDVEPELERGWAQAHGDAGLPWDQARPEVRAAWQRMERATSKISNVGGGVTVMDPVCGMEIEPAQAVAQCERDGRSYYFCSTACKEQFEEKPEAYAPRS
jgi:YHS domain-containing protein